MVRILVVEDEPELRQMLCRNLELEGYEVEGVGDGQPALDRHYQLSRDLWVLDLMLPGMDGFQVVRALREAGDVVPILLLTARAGEADRVTGLNLGADDYLVKPFSLLEFLARVRALLRRGQPSGRPQTMESSGIRLERLTLSAFRGDQNLQLSSREFRILDVLMSYPGRTHSRSDLIRLAWDTDARPSPRTVDVHITNLRRKLGDEDRKGLILTVDGEGYRWTAMVTRG